MIFILLPRPDKPFSEFTSWDLIRIYTRTQNFSDAAKLVKVSRYTWCQAWYNAGLPSPKTTRIDNIESDLPRYSVAVISDMHWGSIYQQKTIFNSFIQDCLERNIKYLIGMGDSIEGLMSRPNHEQSRFLHSIPEYEEYFLNNYPIFENSILINGNHEVSLQKYQERYNFAKEMSEKRSDLTYVKQGTVIEGPGGVKICLHHGGGSCESRGESRNRRMKNRTLQLMSEGSCAPIMIFGHCHRISVLQNFMNAMVIGVGCFCAPDEFTVSRFGSVDIAGLILSYQVDENKHPINIKLDWRFANEYGGIIKDDY